MSRQKLNKIVKSFTISQNVFSRLKERAIEKNLPFSIIIEAVVDKYLNSGGDFDIDFSKYK